MRRLRARLARQTAARGGLDRSKDYKESMKMGRERMYGYSLSRLTRGG